MLREKKKKEVIVRQRQVNRDLPVYQDEDEVIVVEAVPVEEENPSNTDDYFKRWLVIFLTTALFWAVVFGAAWLNKLLQ